MDMDFGFLDNEDFGLAKSFSTAPILAIAPHVNFAQREQGDLEHQLNMETPAEAFVSEGFCFKMAPGQDVMHLEKLTKYYRLAPSCSP
jgi:hypothetical protein